MATDGQRRDGGDDNRTFDAYSDYSYVTQSAAKTINEAVSAYAKLRAAHQERDHVNEDLAAYARSRITEAAILVRTESEQFGAISVPEEWTGDDGQIAKFHAVELSTTCPGWLEEFVAEIRRKGFELGYLQAGSTDTVDERDEVEQETDAMFDDL